jgi:hypothetical protein
LHIGPTSPVSGRGATLEFDGEDTLEEEDSEYLRPVPLPVPVGGVFENKNVEPTPDNKETGKADQNTVQPNAAIKPIDKDVIDNQTVQPKAELAEPKPENTDFCLFECTQVSSTCTKTQSFVVQLNPSTEITVSKIVPQSCSKVSSVYFYLIKI